MGANGDGAPLLPVLYVTANLAFNICSLLVVRTSGGCEPGLFADERTESSCGILRFNILLQGGHPELCQTAPRTTPVHRVLHQLCTLHNCKAQTPSQ